MERQDFYEINQKGLAELVDKDILGKLSNDQAKRFRQRVVDVLRNYEGADRDAASILLYAAERGKLGEYLQKLEDHYEENLNYVHPGARRIAEIPAAVRAVNFFLWCYKEMGIKPHPASE